MAKLTRNIDALARQLEEEQEMKELAHLTYKLALTKCDSFELNEDLFHCDDMEAIVVCLRAYFKQP
jgi:hypothetical protein